MPKTRKTLGRRAKAAPPPKKAARVQLLEPERELLRRIAERTGLPPQVVLERALASYAAAAAPGMPLRADPARKTRKGATDQKLFLSVDGKPEIEIDKAEFILGSGPGVDLRLDLPLIAPRHARILWKGGRPVFEDLRSAHKSYRLGEPIDVRMIETGDEIDLAGFLPIRFRMAEGGV